ncbi:uncharacterized protein LOC135221311 [Macrobrachium nipponense]|uniref:uncharacterized protein LOC135221311 n=1 Tax=Macrobrachium nipponense TaxID=159736 RepID=UPI0030C82713
MELPPGNADGRKRKQEKGAMDTQTVVEDLENTISSLASYLSSNSSRITTPSNESPTQSSQSQQIPSPLCQAPLSVFATALGSDGVQSLNLSHSGSVTSIARQIVSPKDTDSPKGVFRPISPPGSAFSSPLATPSGVFSPLPEDVPPPLPKRGPPVRSSPNPDVFSLPAMACLQSGSPSVSSRISPYHPERSTEFPDVRDRAQVSSVISKTSSDIELFNLYRSDKHNDQRQPLGEIESNLGLLSEEQISTKVNDSEIVKPCSASPDKGTTENEININEEECSIPQSSELIRGATFKDTQLTQSPTQSCLSQRTSQVFSGEKSSSELEHHYSEIDLYTPSDGRDDATLATDLASTASNATLYSPPPVPLHAEDVLLSLLVVDFLAHHQVLVDIAIKCPIDAKSLSTTAITAAPTEHTLHVTDSKDELAYLVSTYPDVFKPEP